MSYQSPTIADILNWIRTIENSSPALAELAEELSKNPNPEYSFRAHIFHHLKSKHGAKKPSLFSRQKSAGIPFPVAYTLEKVNEHSYSDLVQLLFIFDAVEIWIRWLVNVYLGVVLLENEQNLPTQLAGLINEQIKRPAFGSWLTILELLQKNIRNPKLKKLKLPFDNIRPLISTRNSIAHGNISGDLTEDKVKSIQHVEKIIKALQPMESIDIFAVYKHKKFSFVGVELEEKEPISVEDGLFCVLGENTISLPILFRLADSNTSTPLVLSYFSSKGPIKKKNDSSILEYVEINGGEIEHNKDQELLHAFIVLFQTNQKVSSEHPWQDTLKSTKSSLSEAWDFEKELIKTWIRIREEQTEEKSPHILWFGGDVQTGKSTVLTSSLHRLNQNDRLLFLYSFPSQKTFASTLSSEEYVQLQFDRLFRQLRDAIVFWSQQHIKTEQVNYNLSGLELREDCTQRLHLLLELENTAPYHLMIGLDDVHHLSGKDGIDRNAGCVQLREYLDELYIQKIGKYKRGRNAYAELARIRVLFFLTGHSTKNQADLDQVFSSSSSIDRLFEPQTYEEILPRMRKVDAHRYQEIQRYQEGYQSREERGAHLVPIGPSGVLSILTMPKTNKGLLSVFQGQTVHPFIGKVIEHAHNKPLYVHSIAEKLESDELTLDSDLSQISPLRAYFRSRMEEEFISDDRRILAFLICILHHYKSEMSLTLSSLQMLHDQDLEPQIGKEEAILRAIHSAPGLLKSNPNGRKNDDGTLQYAWKLASREIEENITMNKELAHTRIEAHERILWFQKNHLEITEGTELKDICTPKTSNERPFLDTFRALRNRLQEDIMVHKPHSSVSPLFQNIQNGLLRVCSSWNAQKSWLQRCYEFDKNHVAHKEAVTFLEDDKTWNEVWLKQINAPHLPIFDHEKGGFLLHDRADNIIPLSHGYFLVFHSIGTTSKSIFSSVSLCHIEHNQPLYLFTHDDSVDACVSYDQDTAILVYATEDKIFCYPLILDEFQTPTSEPKSYHYDGICGVITLPNNNIAIVGTKDGEKVGEWKAEEINLKTLECIRSWDYASSKASKPQNLFLTKEKLTFHVGATLVRCPYDGTSTQNEKIPGGAPKDVFFVYNNKQERVGIVSTKGTKGKTSSARLDQEPCLAFQEPKKTTAKPIAVFAHLDDHIIVTHDGSISLLHQKSSLNIYDVLTKHSKYKGILEEESVELRGSVLHENELILYGKDSLLCSITMGDGDISSWTLHFWPQLHYGKGGISDARVIVDKCCGFSSPFLLTQSDDNDLRVWDLEKRVCLGLFRAHTNKIWKFMVMGGHLISVDTDKNMRIWTVNKSAKEQYASMPQKQSSYIARVACSQDHLFVLNQELETSTWSNQGANWTQEATKIPGVQHSHKLYGSLKQSISLSVSVACNISNKLHLFHSLNHEHINRSVMLHPTTGNEVKWEIKKLHSTGTDEVLVVGTAKSTDKKSKEVYHFAALLNALGEVQKYREFEYPCTTAAYVDKEQFLVVQEDGNNKKLSMHCWDGAPASTPMEKSFVSTTAINGIYISPSKGKVLLWSYASGRETHFYYVQQNTLYQGLVNPNCTHAPSNIIETKEGLVFNEKDSSRWSLSLQIQEDELSPYLTPISSEMFVLENFSLLHNQIPLSRPYQCSSRYKIFVETECYGVNVYYQSHETTAKLTWMGFMMRNYSIGGIFDEGRIVAYKNREVIVLQVMKGNKEISFAELCS